VLRLRKTDVCGVVWGNEFISGAGTSNHVGEILSGSIFMTELMWKSAQTNVLSMAADFLWPPIVRSIMITRVSGLNLKALSWDLAGKKTKDCNIVSMFKIPRRKLSFSWKHPSVSFFLFLYHEV
jgi:hypothetical protein